MITVSEVVSVEIATSLLLGGRLELNSSGLVVIMVIVVALRHAEPIH